MMKSNLYKLEHILYYDENKIIHFKERIDVLQGLLWAKDNPSAIIEVLQTNEDLRQAKDSLAEKYGLSQGKTQAVIDMRMRLFLGSEGKRLEEEYQELLRDYVTMASNQK